MNAKTLAKKVQTVIVHPKKSANKIKKIVTEKLSKDTVSDRRTYYYKCRELPVDEHMILYEAFAGLGVLDNPRALFKEFLRLANEDEAFAGFTHVWSVAKPEEMEENLAEFRELPNVRFVKKDTKEYFEVLATAKYLVNNSAYGFYFAKRPEQVYLNTWHGIPTKFMGYEHASQRVENARGIIRNIVQADYLVSANHFMTERMYKKAYLGDGVFRGEFLEEGYPRHDAIDNTDREYIKSKLEACGVNCDKKMVLYAPTWKGALYNSLEYDIEEFKNIIRKFRESVPDGYEVYLRVHYFLYKVLADDPEFSKLLIPFTIDTNELLSFVDVLVSDYSSIFFDFIRTGRPVIFYMEDLDEYESGRGLYVPVYTLPGPICKTIDETCNYLSKIDNLQFTDDIIGKYKRMQFWCSEECKDDEIQSLMSDALVQVDEVRNMSEYNEGPSVCERILRKFILDAPAHKETFADSKKHILCFADWSISDGSELSKLRTFCEEADYEKCDITVLTTVFNKDESMISFFHGLPSGVRIMCYADPGFKQEITQEFIQNECIRNLGYNKFDEVHVFNWKYDEEKKAMWVQAVENEDSEKF